MSDFFMPKNTNKYWDQQIEKQNNNKETQNVAKPQENLLEKKNNYWDKRAEQYNKEYDKHFENWNRYGIEVPDEYYEQFNKIISKAATPEEAQEEAYRIGSAIKYSKMYGMPLLEAYQNVDDFNAAQFSNLTGQKARYEALSDMFNLGVNNVKLGNLGQKLMTAHREGDTELAQALMAEIDALNKQNVLMQDNAPRSWFMGALEAGAQTLPYMGAVAGAGIIGNFIAPVAGTAAATAAGSYLAGGQEYIDMIANGSTPETARIVSNLSGLVQGLIEADLGITSGIVKGSARLMGKEAAENFAKKKLEEIGTKAFKRFHFGAGKKLIVNYLKNNADNVLSEGFEEFWQECTSIVGEEIAAAIDGYDIPDDDFKSIVNRTTEAFKGGILGALALGFIPAGINTAADIKEFKQLKEDAETIESAEAFKNAVKDNPVFEGMSDDAKADTINEIWKRAQQHKEEMAEASARAIAETTDFAEGAELNTENEEGSEAQIEPTARFENGRLMIQENETDNEDGTTTVTFAAGDRTKETDNRYGYISANVDEKTKTVTIDAFKMAMDREGLRSELYDEFARKYAGYSIEWNTKSGDATAIKEDLIKNNPSGAKGGLNYYSEEDLTDIETSKRVAQEIKANIHNFERQADGSFKKTELSNKQVASAVALLSAAAKRMNMSLSTYVDNTFGSNIFGSQEDFTKAANAQGDSISGKAGGVNPGVAQAKWQDFGQSVKAVIYAGENADFSTWAHELAHIFQNQLEGDLKAQAEKAFNVIDGDWINSKYTFKDGHVDSAAEAFAYGFQDWLKTGKAESEEMKNIFEKFAEFIARAFNSLKEFINLTPEIESVYNQLLSGDDSLLAKAERAVEENDRAYRQSMQDQKQQAAEKAKADEESAKKAAEAEREEKSEVTEEAQNIPTAEELSENVEKIIDETETQTSDNAINNAIENLSVSDETKAKTEEVLNDPNSTQIDKAKAVTEATGEEYKAFGDMLFQMTQEVGEEKAKEAFNQIMGKGGVLFQKVTEDDLRERINSIKHTTQREDYINRYYNNIKNQYEEKEVTSQDGKRTAVIEIAKDKDLNDKKTKTEIDAALKFKSMGYNPTLLSESLKIDEGPKIDMLLDHNVLVEIKTPTGNANGIAKEIKEAINKKNSEIVSVFLIKNGEYSDDEITRYLNLKKDYIEGETDGIYIFRNDDISEIKIPRVESLQIRSPGSSNIAQADSEVNKNNKLLFQIAGEIGATNLDNSEKVKEGVSRMQNLAIAKEMEADGKDAKTIRLATGWEKGSDGKWKYEIDDGVFARPQEGFKYDFDKDGNYVRMPKTLKEGYLREFYKNNELYKAYPDLKNVWLKFIPLEEGNAGHVYYANGYKIELNQSLSDEEIKKSLVHEIQHIIQDTEGFAKGGNMELAGEFIDKSNEEKKNIKYKAFSWEWKHELDEEEKKYPELRGTTQLLDKLINEYTEDGKFNISELEEEGWLPKEDVRNKGFNLYVRGYDKEGFEDAFKYWQEQASKKGIKSFDATNNDEANRFRTYRKFAGEVEARNVETRLNLTPEQRLNTLLSETEDVAQQDKLILFQTVYHGSGADFDKFNTGLYGFSGEGSMSFGYGTYLTDNEEIARDYAERQRKRQLNQESENPYETGTLEREVFEDLRYFNFSKPSFKKYLETQVENIKKDPDNPYQDFKASEKLAILDNLVLGEDDNKTNLYTVEIPDNGYIQWDKAVRKQTTDKVKRELLKEIYSNPDSAYYSYDKKDLSNELDQVFSYVEGMQLYNNVSAYLEGDENASKFFKKIGYVGIRYPAGTIYGNGQGAYNYVIFNDDDAKIVDHLLFQTQAELLEEAKSFDTWQEFMDFYETMGKPEVTPIPYEADAQWYQSFWETAKGMQTEQEKNEQAVNNKAAREGNLPPAMDALFTTSMRSNPEMLDNFLKMAAWVDAIDFNSEEWKAESEADAQEREKYERLQDFISFSLSDYNWQTAMKRVRSGNEISEGLRKRLLGEITDSFKVRDFRALYAELMEDKEYAVAEEDTVAAQLSKKLQKYQKRYYDILKPNEDISRVSPERRKQIAQAMANRDIANKIANGSLKLDDELDNYIKSLEKQTKDAQKRYDELEAETKADYQRIADAERRKLLKVHEELLIAKSKLKSRNDEVARKVNKGLKITEKYSKESQNLQANYNELFRKFEDLKNSIQINAEVNAALERQEQLAGLKEDLNAKKKEQNLTSEIKKMRIQLVKRVMRRVPFNRIDYNNARTVIAIQRILEPNLIGGVNKFIGIDSPYLRGVISQIVTDKDFKEKVLRYLSKSQKSSQAFVNFKKKIEEMKSVDDLNSWTRKEREYAIKHLPKENWIRDLNLESLAQEREESIDLDIGTEEVRKPVIDPKTGEQKVYKVNGEDVPAYEVSQRVTFSDEIAQEVRDAVGQDMFDLMVNVPFSEWTTEQLETLAKRVDELYTEGRELLAAKNEARKRETEHLRNLVEDAIKETGITINDDDTPEERKKKLAQIAKIVGNNKDLKGTEAGKESGIKARLNRLLHGYSDMNVLRFARMLDNNVEGINTRLLYREEDACFNAKQRSINARTKAVYGVMEANNITEADLAKQIKVKENGLDTSFTVDELLYFLAADKDYELDDKGRNDNYAATSRNAVMFGNMMSDNASQEKKELWDKADKDMKELIKNDALDANQRQLLAIGQLDKTPGTTAYVYECNERWKAVIGTAQNFIDNHPKYRALMEAIEGDYASQYERMNEISITEFNQPVHRVKAYVPLIRRESSGADNVNQVKEDLLALYGGEAGKQWVNKGMTQRRQNIEPLHQKPVQIGLFLTWGSSIERTEHFIAYSPYVRKLNAVYKSRDAAYTRRFMEARYGQGAIKYLDDYINEVANPNANKIREKGAEFLHALRGRTAPAYLGWKFSAVIKQGLTSPFPYMQFVSPVEYFAALSDFTHKETREIIMEKSAFMRSRSFDPLKDLVEEMADSAKSEKGKLGKFDRAWTEFGRMGMKGLEMIDWACVSPGWLACYKKEYAKQQKMAEARYEERLAELREKNMTAEVASSEWLSEDQMKQEASKLAMNDIEMAAVQYADDCTRQCQPSSRAADLAPLFKNSSEAMKAFLQFQTSLNVIWQNIRYDIPYAVKNRQFERIAYTVIGYVMAGIFMNGVMDGLTDGADDDDDKKLQALRNLVYYSTTQFTDAVPIIGSTITNAADMAITGKRSYQQSGTDMTPSATKILAGLTKATTGDFKKAAILTAEGIGIGIGAPVSGIKEINKLLGRPLKEGDVNLLRGVSDVYGITGDIMDAAGVDRK